MHKVIMKYNNIEKYFYFIKNSKTNKNYLAPKSKEIFQYYKNIMCFGKEGLEYYYIQEILHFDTFDEYQDDIFIKENINMFCDDILVFNFPTEEEAFYFKLKYC